MIVKFSVQFTLTSHNVIANMQSWVGPLAEQGRGFEFSSVIE